MDFAMAAIDNAWIAVGIKTATKARTRRGRRNGDDLRSVEPAKQLISIARCRVLRRIILTIIKFSHNPRTLSDVQRSFVASLRQCGSIHCRYHAHTYIYIYTRIHWGERSSLPPIGISRPAPRIAGNARTICTYDRTYLPEVRAVELSPNLYRSPRNSNIGDNRNDWFHRYQSDWLRRETMAQKIDKSRLLICNCNLSTYFLAGIISTTFGRNAFIANGAATTTTTMTTTVRRRQPPLSPSSLSSSMLPVPNCSIDCRPLSRRSIVCAAYSCLPDGRRWLFPAVIRTGLFQVEIRATDFQPYTMTLKSASANTREIAVKQTLRGIDSDRTCALSLAFRRKS